MSDPQANHTGAASPKFYGKPDELARLVTIWNTAITLLGCGRRAAAVRADLDESIRWLGVRGSRILIQWSRKPSELERTAFGLATLRHGGGLGVEHVNNGRPAGGGR